jgi:hypothetical protein
MIPSHVLPQLGEIDQLEPAFSASTDSFAFHA